MISRTITFALVLCCINATSTSALLRLQELNARINALCSAPMKQLVKKAAQPLKMMTKALEETDDATSDSDSEDSSSDEQSSFDDPRNCISLANKVMNGAKILSENGSYIKILHVVTNEFTDLRRSILLDLDEVTMIRILYVQENGLIAETEAMVKMILEMCHPILVQIDELLDICSTLDRGFKRIEKKLTNELSCLSPSFQIYKLEVKSLEEDINGIFEDLEANPNLISSKTLGNLYAFFLEYKEAYAVYHEMFRAVHFVATNFSEKSLRKIRPRITNQTNTFLESFQTCSHYFQIQQSLLQDDTLLTLLDPNADINMFRNEFYHYRYMAAHNRNNLPEKQIYQKHFSVPNNPRLAIPITICYVESNQLYLEKTLIVNDSESEVVGDTNYRMISKWFAVDDNSDIFDPECTSTSLNLKGIKRARSIISSQFHTAIMMSLEKLFIGNIDRPFEGLPSKQIANIYSEMCFVLSGQGVKTLIFEDKKFYDLVIGK